MRGINPRRDKCGEGILVSERCRPPQSPRGRASHKNPGSDQGRSPL